MATIPVVYTLTSCPTCEDLRIKWRTQGIEFEERPVDKGQEWLDEALTYGSSVPIAVYPDGHVEVGFAGEIG
ncbi:glutaredoxin family protein [Dehalococcoidia bacterium]|nr:glutaredoxin family protein [Dehalococcoidia bacterium]